MFAEDRVNGGSVFLAMDWNAAWVMLLYLIAMFDQRSMHDGRSKCDFLQFRYEVATEFIGDFRGRQRIGRPRSLEHLNADRLLLLGHWPKYVEKKGNCVVCQGIMKMKKLPSKSFRHESRIQCEHCSVYLCVT